MCEKHTIKIFRRFVCYNRQELHNAMISSWIWYRADSVPNSSAGNAAQAFNERLVGVLCNTKSCDGSKKIKHNWWWKNVMGDSTSFTLAWNVLIVKKRNSKYMVSLYSVVEVKLSRSAGLHLIKIWENVFRLGWILCPMHREQLQKWKFLCHNDEIGCWRQWESFKNLSFQKHSIKNLKIA